MLDWNIAVALFTWKSINWHSANRDSKPCCRSIWQPYSVEAIFENNACIKKDSIQGKRETIKVESQNLDLKKHTNTVQGTKWLLKFWNNYLVFKIVSKCNICFLLISKGCWKCKLLALSCKVHLAFYWSNFRSLFSLLWIQRALLQVKPNSLVTIRLVHESL